MKLKPKIVIPVVVVAIGFVLMRGRAAKKTVVADVQTTTVATADVERTVSASGKIQPFATVDVKSKAGGTILKMAVEEGTKVKAGQLICLIDRRDNLASYNQAEADVAVARAALDQAQAGAQLQQETLGPQIVQAQETVAASQARLASARSALQQQRESAAAQIRQSLASVSSAKAQLESAQESSGVQPQLTQSAIASARANVASAQASLDSARQSVRGLEGSTLPQAQAAAKSGINQAKSNLDVAKRNLDRQNNLLAKGFVAQTTVDTAQNSYDVAQAALDTAQSRLDTIQEDQDSQKQDAKARIQAAEAALAGARAAYVQATTNRVQDRVKKVDVQAAQANLANSRASLASAYAASRQIAQREADIQAEQATIRQNQAALQTTRSNRLEIVSKRASVVSSRASLQRALQEAEQRARNLAQTTVNSPSDGVVLQKYVDTGAIIQSGESGFSGGTAIVQLADLKRVYVIAQVDESDVADVRPGQTVHVSLDAYPDQDFKGRVRKIFPQADAENNITFVKVQVEILTEDARLRPNLNATCDFELENHKSVLSIPLDAIKEEGKKTFVTLVKDPKLPKSDPTNQEKREIRLGSRGDERAVVKSGLKPGDVIVLPKVAAAAPSGGDDGGPF